jgi:hypothetical protein
MGLTFRCHFFVALIAYPTFSPLEGPFQTAADVSETFEFHALCGSRFMDERFEQAAQDPYFVLK